jgi:hypothetical protein
VASTPSGGPDASEPIPSPTQTPLFHAIHNTRYARQEQIRRIEARTGRRLLCWVAEPHAEIDKFDIPPMGDLLHHVNPGEDVDVMLQTPGGDVDVAEKIVMMCRKRCGGLRVIVPEAAKSAGTFIAVAADQIVMGYASELGPIDPQVFITTPTGESMYRPAQSFLDGLAQIKDAANREGSLSPAYFPILQHVDPALLDFCQKAIDRSRSLAEKWLSNYQCKGDADKATRIAEELGNVEKHLSHGAAIDHDAAIKMGLSVLYLPPGDDLWEALWRLYCDYIMALRAFQQGQFFESAHVSISY